MIPVFLEYLFNEIQKKRFALLIKVAQLQRAARRQPFVAVQGLEKVLTPHSHIGMGLRFTFHIDT